MSGFSTAYLLLLLFCIPLNKISRPEIRTVSCTGFGTNVVVDLPGFLPICYVSRGKSGCFSMGKWMEMMDIVEPTNSIQFFKMKGNVPMFHLSDDACVILEFKCNSQLHDTSTCQIIGHLEWFGNDSQVICYFASASILRLEVWLNRDKHILSLFVMYPPDKPSNPGQQRNILNRNS